MPEGGIAGRRILVVEDEYFLADELDRALCAGGAVVLGPASSVADALTILDDAGAPNAAVLDINLAGEKAYPVADALAARGVPFLFTTGYDRSALPPRHAHVPRLEKPIDTGLVVRELERLVARGP